MRAGGLPGARSPAAAARSLAALLAPALGVPFSGGPRSPAVAATRRLRSNGAVAGVSASGGGGASGGGDSGSDPGLGPLGHGGEAAAVPILLVLLATVALLVRWELRRR